MADMVLGPDGFSYSGSTANENIGQPFYRRAGSDSNYTVGGGWTSIFTSPDWSIPKKSQLVMNFRVPVRSDRDDWGGMWTRTFYRVDSGGWVDCGDSGYTTAMGTGKRMISGHDHMQTFDFLNKTSDFTLGFLVQGKNYSGNNNTGGDHNIDTADNEARNRLGTGAEPWRFYMTLNGWSRP